MRRDDTPISPPSFLTRASATPAIALLFRRFSPMLIFSPIERPMPLITTLPAIYCHSVDALFIGDIIAAVYAIAAAYATCRFRFRCRHAAASPLCAIAMPLPCRRHFAAAAAERRHFAGLFR